LSSPLPSPPLKVGPPKIQVGGLGERCELPSGVWGSAPAKIEFGAFLILKMRSAGNDYNYFKLTKLANFVQFKRMLMFCLEDWGPRPFAPSPPLATPLYGRGRGSMEPKIVVFIFVAKQKHKIRCHHMRFLRRCNVPKDVFGRRSAQDPAGEAHCAPPDLLAALRGLLLQPGAYGKNKGKGKGKILFFVS